MRTLTVAACLALLALAPACAPGTTTTPTAASASSASASPADAIKSGTAAIDVRTPAEFADGHVRGATNIDVQAADFDQRIAALPKGQTYVVYCKSGNRSAQAIQRMKAAGFTALIDGKGYEALRAAGVETATGN